MKKKLGFTLVELLAVMVVLALLLAMLIPNYRRARAESQLVACKSKLKNIAGALEVYSNDYGGRYPLTIAPLVSGSYINKMPRCPSRGIDTYSQTYSPATLPDRYSIYCSGNNHAWGYGLNPSKTANFPQYYGASGFVNP